MSDSTPQIAPKPQVLAELAREIAARIDEQRRRLRRVALGTGLAMAVTVLGLWLASETVTDFLTNLPWIVRLIFFVVGAGGAGAVAWWWGVRLWRRRIDDEAVALMIERSLPAFRSRFIAAVQLAKTPDGSASPALVKALIAETTALAATMDFSVVVDSTRLRRWWKIAVLVLLVVATLALIGGSRTLPLVRRALLGTNPVPRKTLILAIQAPRVLAIGDDWQITATAGGIVPAQGQLIVKTASGRRQVYELPPEGAPPVFGRGLHAVQESFSAVVALGDAESDSFAVRVKPRPAVAGVECRQIFPAYTQLLVQRRALGDLKILAGSRLALKVRTNAVMKSGEIRLLGPERDKIAKAVPLAFDGQGGVQLAGEIEIPREGVSGLTLYLVDEDGVESRSAAVYPIEILPDQPPTIKILWPERREELLTREATLLLAFEAKDDFGVAKVRLHYAVDWVEGAPHKTVELDVGNALPKELTRRFNWLLGRIVPHVEEGSVIDYWLEVLDANDVSGPGSGKVDHYQARIVSDAEKRADLANRLSDTMEGLNGVRQGQEELNRRLGEFIFEKPPEVK
jgi:hypothetical protein